MPLKEQIAPPIPTPGELQTVPARHGTATFVPRGQVIKVVNTYGKQVVAAWVFALHGPPSEEEDESGEEEGEDEAGKEESEDEDLVKVSQEVEKKEVEKEGEDVEGKGAEGAEGEKGEGDEKKTWSSYLPSVRRSKATATKKEDETLSPEEKEKAEQKRSAEASSKGWSSYIPSIRSTNKSGQSTSKENDDSNEDHAENSRKWSAYIPSGKAISPYLPSKGTLSAFAASHQRDPDKSYAEQLYDFSKTPVGAAGLSAAAGSGISSSIYAAYSAYTKVPSGNSPPPMEYLSLAQTIAATSHITPKPNDVLMSNLRAPLATVLEDTTPGVHGTLVAACDAPAYAALGVDKWEEHGSCAENLVMALKELNDKAGLSGARAVGADISVNTAPTPFHLFMNYTLSPQSNTFKIATPTAEKRSFIRLRAERDIVVVLSACPMDLGPQNGGRCMAANFIVEEGHVEPENEKKPELEEKVQEKKKAAVKKKKRDSGVDAEMAREKTTKEKKEKAEKKVDSKQEEKPAKKEEKKEKPAEKKPAEKKPAEKKPSEKKPAEKKLAEKKPAEKKEQQQPQQQKDPNRKKPRKLERKDTPAAA